MTTTDAQRVRFYHGQYVRAQDFEDLVRYFLALVRRHSAAEHDWGIALGLQLAGLQPGTDKPATEGDRELYLQEGVFYDRFGRAGVLTARTNLNLIAAARGLLGGDYQLWALYDQASSVSSSRPQGLCEGAAEDRLTESVKVRFVPNTTDKALDPREPLTTEDANRDYTAVTAPLDDPSAESPVFLGTTTWDGTTYFTAQSDSGRRYIGVRAEEIAAPSGMARIRLGAVPDRPSTTPSAGAASSTSAASTSASQAPAGGQFVLSVASGGTLADKIWVDKEGKVWFDTTKLAIGLSNPKTKGYLPVLEIDLAIDPKTDKAKGVVNLTGDFVLSGDLSFYDSMTTENVKSVTTLRALDARIRSLEGAISKGDAAEFLRYLSPQLAGTLVLSAVAATGVSVAPTGVVRTPTVATGSSLLGISGRDPGILDDLTLESFTSGFNVTADRFRALRDETVVNPTRLQQLGLQVTLNTESLQQIASSAGLSEEQITALSQQIAAAPDRAVDLAVEAGIPEDQAGSIQLNARAPLTTVRSLERENAINAVSLRTFLGPS